MIYLSYYYDFDLEGRLGGVQKKSPQQQQQQQLAVLLDLSAIAAGKKRACAHMYIWQQYKQTRDMFDC